MSTGLFRGIPREGKTMKLPQYDFESLWLYRGQISIIGTPRKGGPSVMIQVKHAKDMGRIESTCSIGYDHAMKLKKLRARKRR